MPLTTDQRLAFLRLMPDLGPDCDRSRVSDFARRHRDAILEEIGAQPGHAQVRAAALRILPELIGDAEARAPLLQAAGPALYAFPEDPATASLQHPAWIGLGVMEMAEIQGDWEDDPLDRAVQVAGAAFESSNPMGVGPAEVIWAMSEAADEVGWLDRSRPLLERALEAEPFSAETPGQLRLLLGIQRLERDGPGAEALLADAVSDEDADARTRAHAAWVLAQRCLERGEPAGARGHLEVALRALEGAGEPDAAARIRAALDAIG